MTDPVVVFLGPSLQQSEAARHLDAIYCPPAEQGSIVAAIRLHNPRALVLIDGSFGKVPAVRHKELLWALSRGIPVYGAGSMGALRAAELWPFGMVGFGFIYRWYRATPLADDDEVAVAMMPVELGAGAMSDALINIRLTLHAAERKGGIAPEVRIALEDIARTIHFVERSYDAIFARARTRFPTERQAHIAIAERFVAEHPIDQKRQDTIGLLRHVAGLPYHPAPATCSTSGFRLTEAWAADLDAAGLSWRDMLPIAAR